MMLLGYSSMGQPELSLKQCEDLAREFGMDFLELRVLEGKLDLPEYFRASNITQTRIPVRVLGSSLRLIDASTVELDEFLRLTELAHRLQVPYLRVFGGGHEDVELPPEKIQQAAALVNQIRSTLRNRGWTPEILLETHTAFSHPCYCLQLNALLREPLGVIWDTHHTWKFAGEMPATTWTQLGPWVRHIHYKDSRTNRETFRYVLPGEGEFPTAALFDLLHAEEYTGGVSLEWEKLWHPDLPPLRQALDRFSTLCHRS